MRIISAVLMVVALISLAACGSASSSASSALAKPKISTATACSDFRHWFLSIDGNVAAVKNLSELQAAVSSAPSGQLYQDLSTLESNVVTTAATSGSLGVSEKDLPSRKPRISSRSAKPLTRTRSRLSKPTATNMCQKLWPAD